MDVTLTEEQKMLEAAVRRFVDKEYAAGQDHAASPQRWQAMADLGLLGLLVPEAHGGLGKGLAEAHVVMRGLGRALMPEPYVYTALVAASLIARGAAAATQASWLPAIAEGKRRLAIAVDDDAGQALPEGVVLRDGRLHGRRSAVWGGDAADALLVPCTDADGTTRLFCIDTRTAGLQRTGYPDIDGQHSAEIAFRGVSVREGFELAGDGGAGALLDWGLDIGRAALCAEASALLDVLLEQTLEHLATRKQFGQVLGSFQVLQHRAVDMMVAAETAHSVALMAAAGIASGNDGLRRRQVSAAKAQLGRCIRQACESATQTFGGMGMTREFAPTRTVRRLLVIDMTWGDALFHTDRFMETMP